MKTKQQQQQQQKTTGGTQTSSLFTEHSQGVEHGTTNSKYSE